MPLSRAVVQHNVALCKVTAMRGKHSGNVRPVGETRKTRLERELAAAAAAYRAAMAEVEQARAVLFDRAGQLQAEGMSWRQLEALTGVQAPTLYRGFQTVVDAKLSKLG